MSKVSVIIPCYNVEKYIDECIHSVLTQTHQDVEIICVNDGSTDNTLSILNKHQSNHPDKIKVLSFNNQGAPASRNRGLGISTGDYIQFLDADDVIHPQKFEKQLAGFKKNTDVVVSDRVQKNEALTKTLHTYYFDEIEKNPLETAIKRVITTCNPLYKKKVVVELGGYNERLKSAQDWEFHIKLVIAGYTIQYIPGIYFINRKVPGSISSDWIKVSIQAAEIITRLKSKLLESRWMNESIRQYIAQLYTDAAVYSSDTAQARRYVYELKEWAGGKYSYMQSPLKRSFVTCLGIATVVRLQRILKKSSQR
jgi:glycosyltransferase involved in cell wall biosynthesis